MIISHKQIQTFLNHQIFT